MLVVVVTGADALAGVESGAPTPPGIDLVLSEGRGGEMVVRDCVRILCRVTQRTSNSQFNPLKLVKLGQY